MKGIALQMSECIVFLSGCACHSVNRITSKEVVIMLIEAKMRVTQNLCFRCMRTRRGRGSSSQVLHSEGSAKYLPDEDIVVSYYGSESS